jgi:hypothetical protein
MEGHVDKIRMMSMELLSAVHGSRREVTSQVVLLAKGLVGEESAFGTKNSLQNDTLN